MNARSGESIRGAALAETAVVVSFTLIVLFGILQLVVISYLQIAGDAATFVAAHEYTLGVSQNTIVQTESSMIPAIIATSVSFTPAPPPTVDPTLFTNVYGAMTSNNRHGGYTMVRPQNFQVYLNQNTGAGATATYKGVFGFNNTPISSGAVEGYYLMTQNEMDNFGVDPNSDVGGNILNEAYASPFLPQSDAIVANMNTPPYYLPNPIMKICTYPWRVTSTVNNFGTQCPSGYASAWYLGLGEYLSNYNYAATGGMGTAASQVFAAMAVHQRLYANLINAFPAVASGAAGDLVLAKIQCNFERQSAGASCPTGVTYAGASYTPPASEFNNAGTCTTGTANQVPIYYYDPMWWWEHEGTRTRPSWNPSSLWASGTSTPPSDPSGDGPEGPYCGSGTLSANWGGATFAMVYAWDQPNFPGTPAGPGSYPTYPLTGATMPGDPGY